MFTGNFFRRMDELGLRNQTLLRVQTESQHKERLTLEMASQIGGLFLDRLPGGLWLETSGIPGISYALDLSRNILQSAVFAVIKLNLSVVRGADVLCLICRVL